MDNGTAQILVVAIDIALLIAGIFTLRLAFSIPARIKIAKAQTKLLAEIAKAQGVSPDVIDGIFSEMNF